MIIAIMIARIVLELVLVVFVVKDKYMDKDKDVYALKEQDRGSSEKPIRHNNNNNNNNNDYEKQKDEQTPILREDNQQEDNQKGFQAI